MATNQEIKIAITSDFQVKGFQEAAASIERLVRSITTLSSEASTSTASFDNLSASVKNSNDKLSGIEKSVNGVSSSFGFLKSAIAGVSILSLAKEAIELADTYKLVEGRLTLVSSSSAELAKSQKELFNISQTTRQEYKDTADLYYRISKSVETLNKSQEDNLKVTEIINKMVILSGSSAESANAAIIQLGQGFASGTLRGQELNSVLEQTPAVAEFIAKGMHVTIGELRKLGEEGKLTAEAVYSAILSQQEAVDKSFSKIPATFEQGSIVIKNSLTKTVGEFDKVMGITSALFNEMKDLSDTIAGVDATGLAKSLKDYENVVLGIGTAFSVMYVATKSAVLAETAYEAIKARSVITTTSYNIATNMTTTTVANLTAAQVAGTMAASALNIALKAIPFIAVVGAVTALATSFFNAKDKSDALNESLGKTSDAFQKLTTNQLDYKLITLKSALSDVNSEIQKIMPSTKGFSYLSVLGLDLSDEDRAKAKANLDSLVQKKTDIETAINNILTIQNERSNIVNKNTQSSLEFSSKVKEEIEKSLKEYLAYYKAIGDAATATEIEKYLAKDKYTTLTQKQINAIVESESEAAKASKKLAEDYAKWTVDISEKTAKAQADDITKPYVELQLQYDKDLAKYGSFVGAKEKLDAWYAAQLSDINEATAKKADEQAKKELEAIEKKQKEENQALIVSSKQRQEYYENIEDYASAWNELERVLRLENTKLTKEQLDERIAYEKKKYLETKGIYEDLYTSISANIKKSTKDWDNYNLIVGRGVSSMVVDIQNTMQDSLVDMMEGKIKSISTFFSNLWSSIKKSFFKMVAEIATKKIIMSFVNAWASGGNTGKGFVETFLGIDIPFLNFAEGTIWGSGKYGIAGGGYNAVDSYANDKIPAMISKGEAVIPASAVNKNKSVVSALIAGSRLDNRGLLDVSYVKKITDDMKKTSMFAGGYDPNELGLYDKASIDANGFYNLKGGGKGGIFGAVLGGIIGAFTGGIGSVLIGAALGGGAGASGLLDPIIEMVSSTFATLMKVPWLGWVAQAALAIAAPELIPTMLTSDLLSTGVTLAIGGDLKQALAGAGISGLLAGGGSAVSSLIKTGALPTSNLTFWETLQNYPSDLYKQTLEKFSQVKDFLTSITSPSALVNPAQYIGVDQTAWLESGSPLEFNEWAKQQMEAQYAAMSSADLFAGTSFANNGGSFMDYPSAYASGEWGFSSYDIIGQPASMSLVDVAREKLLSGLEYAKGLGTSAYETLSEYLTNPEKIFQYILDNLRSVIENIAVSVSSMAGSPLVSALVGSGIANGNINLGQSGVKEFAEGGIVTGPTLGLVGEAGYAEAIIPLHRLGEVTGMEEMQSELQEIKIILREVLRADKTTSMWTERFAVEGIKVRS